MIRISERCPECRQFACPGCETGDDAPEMRECGLCGEYAETRFVNVFFADAEYETEHVCAECAADSTCDVCGEVSRTVVDRECVWCASVDEVAA